MSIVFQEGDITKFSEDIILNPVNCKGISGKGLAKQFAEKFPHNQVEYQSACAIGKLRPGKPQVIRLDDGKCIINFPTKDDFRNPSRIEWIEEGLASIAKNIEIIKKHCDNAKSIGIPKLGAGLGKLKWEDVQKVIVDKMKGLDIKVRVYGEVPVKKKRETKDDIIAKFESDGIEELEEVDEELEEFLNPPEDPLEILATKHVGLKDGKTIEIKDRFNKKIVLERIPVQWREMRVQFNRPVDPVRLKKFLQQYLGVVSSRKYSRNLPSIGTKKMRDGENVYSVTIWETVRKRKKIGSKQFVEAFKQFAVEINREDQV